MMSFVFAGSTLLSGISNQNVLLAGSSRATIFSRGIYAAHKIISPNSLYSTLVIIIINPYGLQCGIGPHSKLESESN